MRTTALIAIMVTALASATAGTATAGTGGEYVALGDSAAAGPLIPPPDLSSPGCLRSLLDYPHVAAKDLGVPLEDVTCSGATTADMTAPQQTSSGPVPPQLDALSTSTRIVTLTIGGNDVGLVGAATSCINLLPGIIGDCVDRFTAGGHDQLAEKIAAFEPVWGELLEAIHAHAPNAAVYLAGYGTYLPHNGCWPIAPLTPRDANYIQGSIDKTNAALARQAAAHDARYVDVRTASIGHDVCKRPGVKWFESVIPTSIAAPLHPNADGMVAIGGLVASSISG
ncbi:SGNH/GDSL hydrolase family protein [Amycolatopsis balhimycina DSM 5908]|uniref:SGNH/GDSL hydrolase family protein n=1 Tax=Amycolatopsis balhimycina DSM 5908 TaxID=1081091 RepID=A0A428WYZ5_AMYBA|nr:SGNH/GDSL hydrolase family protein [Amycolatopsis balhimycina]RSM48286.1 SGNH/GDSL hydrolase family protein [Amycolatopsis balhimycina DSM 5908]